MKNIAYKAFTTFDGIVVHGVEYGIDDKIIFSYQCDGKTVGKIHKRKVYGNASGETYFRFMGRREYLKDYLKF